MQQWYECHWVCVCAVKTINLFYIPITYSKCSIRCPVVAVADSTHQYNNGVEIYAHKQPEFEPVGWPLRFVADQYDHLVEACCYCTCHSCVPTRKREVQLGKGEMVHNGCSRSLPHIRITIGIGSVSMQGALE